MVKLCGKAIAIPLKLILRSVLEEVVMLGNASFPMTVKKQRSSNPQKRL